MDASNFRRISVDGVGFYSCLAFEQIPGLRHAFSARQGSLNLSFLPWDNHDRVMVNRRRLLNAAGLGGTRLATLSQTHSDRILIARAGMAFEHDEPPQGDALISKEAGLCLGVRVADCFPILLAAPDGNCVGAVHAGWRGSLTRILVKAVSRARDALGADPGQLTAAIGPGIRSCCFEVSEEVARLFAHAFADSGLAQPCQGRPGKYMLDLVQALRIQALEAGIKPERTFDLGECTRCRPDEFYSYRAEGERAGRMMAVIGRHGI